MINNNNNNVPAREHEDVTVLWNEGVRTDRDVTANRPDIIIKNKKDKTCILTDAAIPADRNVTRKKQQETKVQEFMYRDTTDVEHEIYDYTRGNWSHRNGNRRFKEKFTSRIRKTFNTFATNDSCTWNITRNAGSAAV
jgi:hypothetical protein